MERLNFSRRKWLKKMGVTGLGLSILPSMAVSSQPFTSTINKPAGCEDYNFYLV